MGFGRDSRQAIVATTSFVEGSIRETVSSSELETQTAPKPTATSSGTAPTEMVASTDARAGSIRETLGVPPLSNSEFTTQRLSNPSTMPIGSPPTGT